MNPQGKAVKIVNSIPALTADGHGLGISPDGAGANVVFIQVIPSQDQKAADTAKEVNATMVANVRITIDQLEKLNGDITKALSEVKKK